jgi:hypothetical protein
MRPDLWSIERLAERTEEEVRARLCAPLRPSLAAADFQQHALMLKGALEKLQRLLPKPVRRRPRAARPRPLPAQTVPLQRPYDDVVLPTDPGQLGQEISGCKTLLLEIIRRAAYDWVLYRSSRKMAHKVLADSAYTWIFVEDCDHPDWRERSAEGKALTSFDSICMHLDLQPEVVRSYIQKLQPKNVMSIGRPAEYRRADGGAPEAMSLAVSAHAVEDAFAQMSAFEEDH